MLGSWQCLCADPLVHQSRRNLSRWAGARGKMEFYAEIPLGLCEIDYSLFHFAGVCKCTCGHCQEYTRDCVLTGLRGHGCGHKTGGEDTGGG